MGRIAAARLVAAFTLSPLASGEDPPVPTPAAPATALPAAPAPRILRLQDLATGVIVAPADLRGPGGVIVYDNLYNPLPGSNPLRLNVAQVDGQTLNPICVDPQPVSAPYSRFALAAGPAHCGDFSETGRPASRYGNFCANQAVGDVWLDDYRFDPVRLAAAGLASDPNAVNLVCRHRFLWSYQPIRPATTATDIQVLRVAFPDTFDRDGDGRYELLGGYAVTVDWLDPAGAAGQPGIYLFDIDLAALPGGGILLPNRGAVLMDVEDLAVDAFGQPLPGDLACGTQIEIAGGFHAGASCSVAEMHSVGQPSPDDWAVLNLVNSARTFIDPQDPNKTLCHPLSSLPDGDPAALSYEDAVTDGLLVNPRLQYGLPTGTIEYGGNLIASFAVTAGGSDPCPADVSGDGDIGFDDLLILLGAFGINGDGDMDGDGLTGLDDLLILLAAFGQSCP